MPSIPRNILTIGGTPLGGVNGSTAFVDTGGGGAAGVGTATPGGGGIIGVGGLTAAVTNTVTTTSNNGQVITLGGGAATGTTTNPPTAATTTGTGANVVTTPPSASQPNNAGFVQPGGTTGTTPVATKMPGCDMDHGTGTVTGGGTSGALAASTSQAGRRKPIGVRVGGASFHFPSLAASSKHVSAPKIHWGAGWKSMTDASGANFMRHTNGTEARVSTRARIFPSALGKMQHIKTAYGRAWKFPDGTVMGVDKSGAPYRLGAGGAKQGLSYGRFEFGGVKVTVREITIANVTTPDGRKLRYDSRGNSRVAGGGVVGGGPVTQASTSAQTTTPTKGGGGSSPEFSGLIGELLEMAHGMLEGLEGIDDGDNASMLSQAHSMLSSLPAMLSGTGAGAALSMAGLSGTTEHSH